MTIADAAAYGYRMLEALEAGPLDTTVLLAYASGKSRTDLIAHPEALLTDDQAAKFRSLVLRRATHEPIAYLCGTKEFYGLSFLVDARVLIPRPDTECMVQEALAIMRSAGLQKVVDVGTGSGCIAITLAVHDPLCGVIALDTSAAALAVARENATRHGVADRVTLRQADWVAGSDGPIDIVVANLPYLTSVESDTLMPDVRLYEPRSALDGGADGLDYYRVLFDYIAAMDSLPHAMLIEISPPQALSAIREITTRLPGARTRIVRDLSGQKRVIVIEW